MSEDKGYEVHGVVVTAMLSDPFEMIPPLLGVLIFGTQLSQQPTYNSPQYRSISFKSMWTTKERLLVDILKRGPKTVFQNLPEKSWVHLDSHWIAPCDVLEPWRENAKEEQY